MERPQNNWQAGCAAGPCKWQFGDVWQGTQAGYPGLERCLLRPPRSPVVYCLD